MPRLASARWPLGVTLVVAGLVLSVGDGRAVSGTIATFGRQLSSLESATSRMSDAYAQPVAMFQTHDFETRLIEAKILFELNHFESASVMLVDLVDNKSFRSRAEYMPMVLMLAESLISLGNPRAAARYLKRVASGTDPALRDQAAYLLLVMAFGLEEDTKLRGRVARMAPPRSDRTRYALGKAHVRLENFDQALAVLAGVPRTSPFSGRARYYGAVALTGRKQFDRAAQEFRALSALEGDEDGLSLVRDLSWLALGRLAMESGDLVGAVTHYQRIPRNSPSYEVGLYEMAWAYIKAEQYDKALGTIDALLLTVKDPVLDVEAHTLRGRLNIYLNDYDTAVETFEKIVSKFAPIRNELSRFIRDPRNVQRYFRWLLERHGAEGKMQAPLTKRTAIWVESTGDMKRVARVFDSLSAQSQEVEEVRDLAKMLERIVASRNRVELFPDLKDGWTQALVLQNRYIALSSKILDHQYGRIRPRIQGQERDKLDGMKAWRKQLEARFRGLPMTFEQFKDRRSRVDTQFLDLKRQGFVVGQRLKDLQKELLAIEQYVNDHQYAEQGKKWSADREEGFRIIIADEKQSLLDLGQTLTELRADIELEARRVGAGSEATEGDSHLREALIAAHKREGLFYDASGERFAGGSATDFVALASQRERIWAGVDRMAEVIGAIDGRVGAEVAKLRGTIRKEARRVAKYAKSLSRYRARGRDLAQEMGSELFERARDDMKSLVLGADVGLIDVVWRQKRHNTDSIRKLNREKSEKLSSLDRSLERLTTDRIGDDEESGGEGAATEGGGQ